MSIFSAAGTFGSPGIVIISPASATINPAPFEIRIVLISTVKPVGRPRSDGLSESEYWVFAIHTGFLSRPSSLSFLISFFALFENTTPLPPYTFVTICLTFSSIVLSVSYTGIYVAGLFSIASITYSAS